MLNLRADLLALPTLILLQPAVSQPIVANCDDIDIRGDGTQTLSEVLAQFQLLPDDEGNATELLNCADAGLVGPIPDELFQLTGLKTLNLGLNLLTGTVPSTAGNLEVLQALDLSENCLTGPLPDSVLPRATLTSIDIGRNKFSGSLDDFEGSFEQLVDFFAEENDFSGSFNSFIEENTQLERISLVDNRLEGEVTDSFANLVSLSLLFLTGNELEGQMPQHSALAVDTDVPPGFEFPALSLGEKLSKFPLDARCPNMLLFSLEKFFTEALPQAIGAAVGLFAIVVLFFICCCRLCHCCCFSAGDDDEFGFDEDPDDESAVRKRSAWKMPWGRKRRRSKRAPPIASAFMSHSMQEGHAQYDRMIQINAMFSEKRITPLMREDDDSEDAVSMKLKSAQVLIVYFTADYLGDMQNSQSTCMRDFKQGLESGVKKVIFCCMEKNLFMLSRGMKLMESEYEILDMKTEQLVEENFVKIVAQVHVLATV